MEPLKFGGIYKDYLWGGNKIKEIFNIKTEVSPVAENWVLSTHPDGMSIIEGGIYDGISIKEYIEKIRLHLEQTAKKHSCQFLLSLLMLKTI